MSKNFAIGQKGCGLRYCLQGCKLCRGCLNSPIRGSYDGLVVLAAVTKDMMPKKDTKDVSGMVNSGKGRRA